ncbi:MAG: polyprenyl synthetase family protein [Bdellovibrionota bacterium]
MLESALKKAIHSSVTHPELREILDYAVLPAGKLFRPRLVEAIALDLDKKFSSDHLHLACALEIHHAYTLVHDDLPAMDNDLVRRGKPSTHAKYGEWKAILAGDALLISSFETLMKIESTKIRDIHRLFSWCTGGKGLILGQFLDLGSAGKVNTPEVIRIHELKTARLIQAAVAGAALISQKKFSRDFFRLGREIGVTFQLLDDLNELTDEKLSPHEKDINPFLLNRPMAMKAFNRSFESLKVLMEKEKLTHLNVMLQNYFEDNRKALREKSTTLAQHLQSDVMNDLKGFL